MISAASAIVALVLRAGGWLPTTPATEHYYSELSRVDWAITGGLMTLQIVGATLLWLLRREALWFLMAAIFLGGVNFVRHVVTRDFGQLFAELGALGPIMMVLSLAFGLLVSAAVLAYVWGLYRRGVLA